MKPYFAKRLVVEGDIRPGDKWITPDGVTHSTSVNIPESAGVAKRIQLFLCSRDIKEGDKVHENWDFNKTCVVSKIEHTDGLDPEEHRGCSEFHTFIEKSTGYLHHIEHYYKVIGPISKKAKWVKEGDEWDEDELIALEWGGSSTRVNVKHLKELWDGKSDEYPRIYIPCPHCGQFT